jgi:transposase
VNTRIGRATVADQEASGEFQRYECGLDVHALSVVAHAFDEETGRVERARLCPDHGEILAWLHQLRGPVRVAYEAGPTGFGLARALAAAEIDCIVAAPSKLIRPSGDRVKTDARDAAHLTRLLRLGEVTAVTVSKPTWRPYGIWSAPARMPVRI